MTCIGKTKSTSEEGRSTMIDVMKCLAKSKHKPPVCNSRASVCARTRIPFGLGIGLLFTIL